MQPCTAAGKASTSSSGASTRPATRICSLALVSPDGDQGFPGELSVKARYSVEGNTLRLSLEAVTSKPTPVNLSAHPYFNLAGVSSGDILGHEITIAANEFLPTDRHTDSDRRDPARRRYCFRPSPADRHRPPEFGALINNCSSAKAMTIISSWRRPQAIPLGLLRWYPSRRAGGHSKSSPRNRERNSTRATT